MRKKNALPILFKIQSKKSLFYQKWPLNFFSFSKEPSRGPADEVAHNELPHLDLCFMQFNKYFHFWHFKGDFFSGPNR